MSTVTEEPLSIDFSVSGDVNKFTKTWATDLVSTLRDCFKQVSVSITDGNLNIVKRLDELESTMKNDVLDCKVKSEAALDLATQNSNAMKELRADIQQLKVSSAAELQQLKDTTDAQYKLLKQSSDSEIQILKQSCAELRNNGTAVQVQTNNLECYSRRDNLIFYGIPKSRDESNDACELAVRKFLKEELHVNNSDAMPFVRCHRMHERRSSKIKPIIVRFCNYRDREIIWLKKKTITNRAYHIGEDFPRQIAYNRRKLLPVFNRARSLPGVDKKVVSLKSDVLTISGRRYYANTLDQLGGDLSMKHFNEISNNDLVVFGGIYSDFHPLSNYYICPVQFNKISYTSIEQAYQHRKCLFFDDLVTASKVMLTSDPAEAKRLSFEVKGSKALYDRWTAQRYKLMSDLLKAKIQQNPKVKAELLSTGTKRIAESGKDNYYAVGLPITSNDILNNIKWSGKSKLGEILMSVRSDIE